MTTKTSDKMDDYSSKKTSEAYKACCYMEHGLCFDNIDIRDCCIGLDGNKRGMPVIIPNYKGEIPDWNKIFEHKRKRNELVEKGEIPKICEGCGALSSDIRFTDDNYFSEIIYQSNNFCNSKCIYCSSKVNRGVELYSALKATKDLIKNGFFKKGGNVFFGGGEPSIMRDFDEIVNIYLENEANIFVETSGISYKQSIYNGIKMGKLKIVVSLDCGNKKLYNLIKQTDKFNEVIQNLNKYSEALDKKNRDCIKLKYILIPGINDSVKCIDEFFKLVKKLKVKNVLFDIECCYLNEQKNGRLPSYLYYLSDYAENIAYEQNIDFAYNIFHQWANQSRKIKKKSFKKFDKTAFIVKIEKEKEKNINKNRYYPGIAKNFSKVNIS